MRKKTKKIKHNRIEMCRLSKKKIDTEVDNYTIVIDCKGNNIHSVGFYKTDLFTELVSQNYYKLKKEIAMEYLQKASRLLMGINRKAVT